MKSTFKEYHQFTDKEFKKLWSNSLFVLDTNTLLNMYRYSRETVEIYFKVLNKLKTKQQLWIPYQVGYEFYENRINVISEYENSYDEILSILEKTKKEIENKYKEHPFLNLKDINDKVNSGLSSTERAIRKAKNEHPKWLEKDEVLEKINDLFKDSVGENYDATRLSEIKLEGEKRYDKKIPPGFKDNKKEEGKKFGDLILWYQIMDKAKDSKKSIIFISGDVKEDWWLEKNGKRLMPLPQLKKEIYEKSNSDFHIYTADRFLKLSENEIDERTIKEVRKIRENEEKRILMRRMELRESSHEQNTFKKYTMEYIHLIENLESLYIEINETEHSFMHLEEFNEMLYRLKETKNRIIHGDFNRKYFNRHYEETIEFSFILEKLIHSGDIYPKLSNRLRMYIEKLKDLNRKLGRYL